MKKKYVFLPFLFLLILSGCATSSNTVSLNEKTIPDSAGNNNVSVDKKINEISNKNNNSNQKNMENENNNDETSSEVPQEDLTQKYSGVVIKTNVGDIAIKLYGDQSPITVNNFLTLASNNYFDGIKFHRVIKNFMIQGGDPNTKDDSKKAMWGTGGPGYAIPDEYIPGLTNKRGSIAMANSGPNTGGSQFFINLVDNTFLDWDKEPLTSKHPAFGEVVEGMDIVDKIGITETEARDVPASPIIILSVELTEK